METIKVGVANFGTTAVECIHPGDMVATSSFDKLRNHSKVVLSSQLVRSGTSGSKVPGVCLAHSSFGQSQLRF
jgi:membrane fusion protein, multidrug efflux system